MTRTRTTSRSKKQQPPLAEPAPVLTPPETAAPPQIPPESDTLAPSQTDFTTLPFFNHPGFQEIYAQWQERGFILQELTSIFKAGRYSIKSSEAFKGVLEDVFSLYDVTNGKKPASELLRTIEKHVAPAIFYSIVMDLGSYLAPHLEKFIQEMSDAGPNDPAKLQALALLTGVKEWEKQWPTFQHRMEVSRAFGLRVNELSRQAGVTDADEIRNLQDALSKKVGADPALLARIDGWDFSEVERLFQDHRRESRSIN